MSSRATFSKDYLNICRIHHLITNNISLKWNHGLGRPRAILACAGVPLPCKGHLSRVFLGVPKCTARGRPSQMSFDVVDTWGLCWAEAPARMLLAEPEIGPGYCPGCAKAPRTGCPPFQPWCPQLRTLQEPNDDGSSPSRYPARCPQSRAAWTPGVGSPAWQPSVFRGSGQVSSSLWEVSGMTDLSHFLVWCGTHCPCQIPHPVIVVFQGPPAPSAKVPSRSARWACIPNMSPDGESFRKLFCAYDHIIYFISYHMTYVLIHGGAGWGEPPFLPQDLYVFRL